MNLNRVYLAGRLTRDPEVRYTPSGTAIADIGLAVSRFFKNDQGESKEETDFFDVTAFGKTAEVVQKHLRKGSPIYVEGRLKLDQWDDRETGKKRSKVKIIAEAMQFVGPKPQGSGEPTPSPALQEQRARQTAASPPARPSPKHDPDLDVEPDDIPF
jgi:single-strand DNA-binding protein